jgi:hypothetical protein
MKVKRHCVTCERFGWPGGGWNLLVAGPPSCDGDVGGCARLIGNHRSGHEALPVAQIAPETAKTAMPIPKLPMPHSRLVGRSCGGFGEPEKRKERSGVVKGVSAAAGEHTAKRTLDDATSDLCWQKGGG